MSVTGKGIPKGGWKKSYNKAVSPCFVPLDTHSLSEVEAPAVLDAGEG
jgi:hypothetical protein